MVSMLYNLTQILSELLHKYGNVHLNGCMHFLGKYSFRLTTFLCLSWHYMPMKFLLISSTLSFYASLHTVGGDLLIKLFSCRLYDKKVLNLCDEYGVLISDNIHCIKRHIRFKFD